MPKQNVDPTAPHIRVGTSSGQPMTSSSTCYILIPELPSAFPITGHVMPCFHNNFVGVGPMCDADYTVTFNKHAVTFYSPNKTPIITGWSEADGPRLWRMSLLPNLEDVPPLSSTPNFHKNLPARL